MAAEDAKIGKQINLKMPGIFYLYLASFTRRGEGAVGRRLNQKSFDEVKNKLGEKKAWATSATAKSMQAQFICLSINLLQLIEHEVGQEGIHNVPEEKRRAQRLDQAKTQAASRNTVLPKTLIMMQQMTQHSVKLIRWVAAQLWLNVPWKQACAALVALYAKL